MFCERGWNPRLPGCGCAVVNRAYGEENAGVGALCKRAGFGFSVRGCKPRLRCWLV